MNSQSLYLVNALSLTETCAESILFFQQPASDTALPEPFHAQKEEFFNDCLTAQLIFKGYFTIVRSICLRASDSKSLGFYVIPAPILPHKYLSVSSLERNLMAQKVPRRAVRFSNFSEIFREIGIPCRITNHPLAPQVAGKLSDYRVYPQSLKTGGFGLAICLIINIRCLTIFANHAADSNSHWIGI